MKAELMAEPRVERKAVWKVERMDVQMAD